MKNLHLKLLLFLLLCNVAVAFAQENIIEIKSKFNDNKTVDISYVKHLPGSYYIELIFTKLENCSNSDIKRVIKSNSGRLVRLKPINPNNSIRFSYRYKYIYGTPRAKVDKDFRYVLPFKKGKEVKILETVELRETAFHGKKENTWKSFVTKTNTADTVYNMRKGIVTKIVAKYDEVTSENYDYTSTLNTITVEHKDGTVAEYKGFNKNGIFVEIGQKVYPHSALGVLGHFGKSEYRLYFDVSYRKPIGKDFFKQYKLSDPSRFSYVNPFFYCKEGVMQLHNRQKYTSDINDEVRFKEFSRREKRKYKKHPERFK